MANKYANNEETPANSDDALEGPLRIREIKQAYNERLARDHYMGSISNPDVIAGGADSTDSGYHRRVTITELTSDQASTVDTRINGSGSGVNHGTTSKMSEVWVEKHSGTSNECTIRINGSDATARDVITNNGTQTLTNKTLTAPVIATVDINSGTIDGTTIGVTSPSTGKFTTLECTGNATIGDATGDTISLKGTTSGDSETHSGANQNFSGLVGEIRMYGGSSAPTGWLFCDGSSITASKYSALATVLGSTTLPDLRGRLPMGAGTGAGLTARSLHDKTLGAETYTLEAENMPRHTHVLSFSDGSSSGSNSTKHTHATQNAAGDVVDFDDIDAEDYQYILRKQNDGSQSTGAVDTSAGEPDVVTASKMATISHTVAHTGGTGSANEDANGTAKGYLPPLYIVNFIIKY